MAASSENAMWIIATAFHSIFLLINLLIGSLVVVKTHRHSGTSREIKLMFICSFVLACAYTIACMVQALGHFMGYHSLKKELAFVAIPTALFYMLSLLVTLVVRLHLTFKSSSYRMSRRTSTIFMIAFISQLLIGIVHTFCLLKYYQFESDAVYHNLGIPSLILFYLLFFVSSFFAVRLFVQNLLKIARCRATSQKKLTICEEHIAFDQCQMQLLNVSARYILLYLVATVSTIVTFPVAGVFSKAFDLPMLGSTFLSFDYSLNLLCLYLQFSFAAEHYQRLCSCLDKLCRGLILSRTRKVIHREAVQEVSPRTPPSTTDTAKSECEEGHSP